MILYFFLLILRILLNPSSDVSYKQGGFSEILLKDDFEFVTSRKNNIVTFNLSFILLLVEADLISEKQSCEKDAFVVPSSGHIEIIFILLTEVIALYMQALIVKTNILGFK